MGCAKKGKLLDLMMKRVDSINVIPMIDIMLVMLAIVLTTATFIVHDHIQVDLPVAKSSAGSPSQSTSYIVVDRQGSVFLDDQRIGLTELDRALSGFDPEKSAVLRVDREARFGDFTNVVDLLKSHQINSLSILVQPSE